VTVGGGGDVGVVGADVALGGLAEDGVVAEDGVAGAEPVAAVEPEVVPTATWPSSPPQATRSRLSTVTAIAARA
jgi:hypothetical protein